MRRVLLGWFLMACFPVAAAEPPRKLIAETWDAAFLDGTKSGHFHTTVHEVQQGDQALRSVQRTLQLTIKRFGQLAQIDAQVGTLETPTGQVLGVSMNQGLGKNQQLLLVGKVVGDFLHVTLEGSAVKGGKIERKIPWDDKVIGLLGEENLLRDKKAKPGDKLSYRLFEPTVNNIVTTHVRVGDWEAVPLNGVTRKLLRVETRPEKIQDVQLPMQTLWYDAEFKLVRSQVEMPGMGELTLVRGTKADAMKPVGQLRDISDLQSIVLPQPISQAHKLRKIVFRFNYGKAEEVEKMFAVGDGRQEVRNGSEKGLELHITAVRRPPASASEKLPGDEFLKSNFFINCDDKVVQKHAADAVGTETNPWHKALLIEHWVNQNMKGVNFTEAMATADQVARTLSGDCTEYSMLCAAMCRAQGIPSRTAIGLVYHVDAGKPKLSYHMWTEVWLNGAWLALDATLGQGNVGPAHVKITDHSWHETRSLTPLLPVMRVMMSRPKVEVLSVVGP